MTSSDPEFLGGPTDASAGGLFVDDVSVAYDGATVLDRLTLTVGRGETVALVGPSGSGKSTLLRAIAGLEPLAGGRVVADGRSLDGVATHQRDLGLMFQEHALFHHVDVAGNVAFGLRMKGWSTARQDERVGELLALVGLAGFGGRAVHELSGGEAQRVALARALAPEPALLMLDEPFGSLDRVLREQLTGELRALLAELGQTALHVTHDQGEAFALADRIAVLDGGRLRQVGTPAEVWWAPASRFVAEFVGHPNIVEVDVQLDGDGRRVVSLDGTVLGRAFSGSAAAPGDDSAGVRLGTVGLGAVGDGRYEVVIPVAAIEVASGGPLVVRVEASEFRDGRRRVTARTISPSGGAGGGGRATGRALVFDTPADPRGDGDSALRPGDEVTVSVAVDKLHLLDQEPEVTAW